MAASGTPKQEYLTDYSDGINRAVFLYVALPLATAIGVATFLRMSGLYPFDGADEVVAVATPPPTPVAPVVTPPAEVPAPQVTTTEVMTPPEPEPTVKYVSRDTYRTAELNLGGTDTGEGGIAERFDTNNPTAEDIQGLQKAVGSEMTEAEAAQALRDGGFVKDGKTYEIWANGTHVYTTQVHSSHRLVGRVVNLDS